MTELRETLELLTSDNRTLRRQVDVLCAQARELQARLTAMEEGSRERTVRAFHARFGHPVADAPTVPSKEQVQFRLKLIAEEFFELLAACEIWPRMHVDDEEIVVCELIKDAIVGDFSGHVDLPEFVDAMADLDYVVEGTRVVFGVLGEQIHAAVHAANMAKEPVYIAVKDDGRELPDGVRAAFIAKHGVSPMEAPDPTAKPTKPAGWAPPAVARLLEDQGWRRGP